MAAWEFQLTRNRDRQTLHDALAWVSSINSRAQQSHLRASLERGTGGWFLNSPQFETWLKNPRQVLLCPGIPGAGKTMIVATVVDYLQASVCSSEGTAGLVYIYCDYKSDRSRTLEELLGEMIKQLVEHDEKLAVPLLDMYDRHFERQTFPTADEICEALESIISRRSAAYLIIDAIDEVSQERGKRQRLAEVIAKLQTKLESIRLMVTFRPLPDMAEVFKDSTTLEIKAVAEDIGRYVSSQFEYFKVSLDDGSRQEVRDCILETSNGL